MVKGPYIKDVRKNSVIFDTPLPLVRISRNLSVLFVRKIEQFLNPPPPLRADVLYVWPLTYVASRSRMSTLVKEELVETLSMNVMNIRFSE